MTQKQRDVRETVLPEVTSVKDKDSMTRGLIQTESEALGESQACEQMQILRGVNERCIEGTHVTTRKAVEESRASESEMGTGMF